MSDQPCADPTPNIAPPDPLAHEKLLLEVKKLHQEIEQLRLGNAPLATLGRNIWPLVSGVLTITVSGVLAFITWHAQTFSAQQDRDKVFFSAVQMATDPKTTDGRIAGVWSLSQYWHDPRYSDIVANTLSAVLVTEADSASPEAQSRVDAVREAAADVIGDAIDKNTREKEKIRLAKLLYGDARDGSLGSIAIYESYVGRIKPDMTSATFEVWQAKHRAIREAVRKNWEYLENGNFHLYDLTGIQLYQADAKGASFLDADLNEANLCGAQLAGSNFTGARLTKANLSGADLSSTAGWDSAIFESVDIHNVKNAPPEFLEAAKRLGFDMKLSDWVDSVNLREAAATNIFVPLKRDDFTSCDKYD